MPERFPDPVAAGSARGPAASRLPGQERRGWREHAETGKEQV